MRFSEFLDTNNNHQKKEDGYLIKQDQVETLKIHLKHVQNLLYIENHNDIFKNVFVSLLR